MELHTAEAESLKKNLAAWLASPDQELEATFGVGGRVDVTTFLTVAKRLRARGYVSLPQEDRLTITLPEHIRFTLVGPGLIQEYCRDDVLASKPFVVMIKDRTLPEANTDLEDYDVRVKVRRELELNKDDAKIKQVLSTWNEQKKAFRLIRRWSFEGDGMIIDMSIVRSSTRDMTGSYKWQKKFNDQNVSGSVPIYEIEVELKRKEGDTPELALKRLIKGVGEILRGIQKHTFLIRKSVKDRTLRSYKEIVGSESFRGVAPITMELENFAKVHEEGVANVRDGYNVTDKADGLRVMGLVDSKGELFMIDMGLNVYKTGLTNENCRGSLVDGEWVTQTREGNAVQQLCLFDIYVDKSKQDVTKLPFYVEGEKDTRYERMNAWVKLWNDGTKVAPGVTVATRLQVAIKQFYFATAGDLSIFNAAARVLDTKTIYNTDGLIFTPNKDPLPAKFGTGFEAQFKWKPAHDNSVDFLVSIEKFTDSQEDRITVAAKPDTGETITYKTMRLLVGGIAENARDVILRESFRKGEKSRYRPVVFNPKEFPDTMASICYRKLESAGGEDFIMTDNSQEPIQDKSIVECAYDPSEPPGWRWKPIRIRMDKTERLQRGILSRTLNSEATAESIWNSIHDPITESMIRTGSEQPTEGESMALSKEMESRQAVARRYYERKAPEQDLMLVRGLRDFHNKFVKNQILFKAGLVGGKKTLLDLAVGKAADLHKWRAAGVSFVFGVDNAGDNIIGSENSAYDRYLGTIKKMGAGRVAPMIFAIADSSKRLSDGSAGATDQEKDILRAVFGQVRPVSALPPFVEREGASRLKMGADCVAVMFALHYFFSSKETFDGFLRNVADGLKQGGYFIGCCFDGKAVFDMLRKTEKGKSKAGMSGDAHIWSITKQYDEDDMPSGDAGFGLPIDVEFISIGTSHREYLMPFELLKEKMESIGCELLNAEDLKEVGLPVSTALFSETFDIAKKQGQKYVMNDTVKEFSFLNRWFVFKRKGEGKEPLPSDQVAMPAAALSAPPPTNERPSITTALKVPTAKKTASKIRIVSALPATATATATPAADVVLDDEDTEPEPDAGPVPLRTLPVAPGLGAAPVAKKTYLVGEVFQFYNRSALQDRLKIGDKGAGRWLSPSAPFPIEDPDDSTISYPSVDHYLAAMFYKRATNKPELAVTLLSREGSIHQEYNRQRLAETEGGKKPIAEDRDYELLEQENKDVKNAMRPATLKKYKATFDEVKWASLKDDALRQALSARWTRDARFRKIIEAARNQGKMLLYYTPGGTTNMGGMLRQDGTLDGDNKVGLILMELAAFPGM